MNNKAVIRRAAVLACLSSVGACTGVYYGGYAGSTGAAGGPRSNYATSSRLELHCATGSIPVCEQTDRGRECACEKQSVIWPQSPVAPW